ncbi:MAG: UDP-N-acetylmuramoyl-L-alanine--D-glutamate ligase [Candidatus Polarisedimenticolaceae bacterium]|nr:UDP-N-acetylmuramoyl-L-alanine--D-glutamate ligase [Candidatus Polarisedimenticolaceae bacterium]
MEKSHDECKRLVVGLGKTGLSCVRFLSQNGKTVAVTDSRDVPPALAELNSELPDVAVFVGGFRAEIFAAADQLIVSPGVSLREPLLQQAAGRNAEIIGDIELFAREAAAPIIVITGSNGKSTVTTLLGVMVKHAGINVAMGGNLGEPALNLLDDKVELYLLELSSFQLETTESLYAVAAVVLNISPDHLDRYDSIEEYAATKSKIYRGAEIGVINRDDPMVCAMMGEATNEVGFTLQEPSGSDFGLRQDERGLWFCKGEERLMLTAEMRQSGSHNHANALAALALGEAIGLPMAGMLEVLRHFAGLPHRTQFITKRRDVDWYDDSKGTNTGATISALKGLALDDGSRTVLIAGGVAKGADFRLLRPVVAATTKAVVLIGEATEQLEETLSGCAPLHRAATMDEAVKMAAELAAPGDRVLLSPACASFDMFDNYQQRGEIFIAAVDRLGP